VTLGGTGSSVVVADIDASTAAQLTGPVDVVTIDANGTLGRQAAASMGQLQSVSVAVDHIAAVSDAQFNALTGRVSGLESSVANLNFQLSDLDESTRGGIASAVAMGGMMVVPDKTVSISLNAANYRGEQGFAGGITARISDGIYLSGGIGGSTAKKSTTTRVGVAFGF
jgi:autotransporter adhesin